MGDEADEVEDEGSTFTSAVVDEDVLAGGVGLCCGSGSGLEDEENDEAEDEEDVDVSSTSST